MKPYEYKRFYHPRLGKFVYMHKGSGIIVDNIFKPLKRVASAVGKKVVKPFAKKAVKADISHAGEKLGKKAAEKSGDQIMKMLRQNATPTTVKRALTTTPTTVKRALATPPQRQKEESTDIILNRLISGTGIKKRRKIM